MFTGTCWASSSSPSESTKYYKKHEKVLLSQNIKKLIQVLHKHAQKPYPINSQSFCQKFLMFWRSSALISQISSNLLKHCNMLVCLFPLASHFMVFLSGGVEKSKFRFLLLHEEVTPLRFLKTVLGSQTMLTMYVTSPDSKLGRKEKNLQLTSPMIHVSLSEFGHVWLKIIWFKSSHSPEW